jgi:hypothetical protein
MGIHVYKGEEDIKDHGNQAGVHVNGKQIWVTARLVGYQSFWHRIKCAWLVFQEKADIVIWEYQ